ncbi:MAG TPA: hypothetical protein PKK74_08315 [Candidatus Methanoculleus thermohydrogenotrophicum]|jgi:hypothetical protein|nr:hypothetical protein [Candidatus Methanoculleus thermohydrogenotrophicum]HPZ38747.1 hypothetical protein [Candidatus Methanoculleus thermohydrogenotrophicum]HQC91920.1 hypothetical protein [Candidatus Methanoculleus thermohydrogenotrophicum]
MIQDKNVTRVYSGDAVVDGLDPAGSKEARSSSLAFLTRTKRGKSMTILIPTRQPVASSAIVGGGETAGCLPEAVARARTGLAATLLGQGQHLRKILHDSLLEVR